MKKVNHGRFGHADRVAVPACRNLMLANPLDGQSVLERGFACLVERSRL